MPVSTSACVLSFGRCRMSKFWLLVYFGFSGSLRRALTLPCTLHRAPVGQGPPGPGWLAISFGFWSGRALATGTAWAGLCLIHHHHPHPAVHVPELGRIGGTAARRPLELTKPFFFKLAAYLLI